MTVRGVNESHKPHTNIDVVQAVVQAAVQFGLVHTQKMSFVSLESESFFRQQMVDGRVGSAFARDEAAARVASQVAAEGVSSAPAAAAAGTSDRSGRSHQHHSKRAQLHHGRC